jgi:transposase
MLGMSEVHVVRHKVLVEGQKIRRVAREMGISRNTVRKYLAQAAPVRVEKAPRGRPVWQKVGARLEALLADSPQWLCVPCFISTPATGRRMSASRAR